METSRLNQKIYSIEKSIDDFNIDEIVPGHSKYMKYYLRSHLFHTKKIYKMIPILSPDDKLLEIGVFMGFPLILARKKYGCTIIGTDLMRELERNKNFHKAYGLLGVNVKFSHNERVTLPFHNSSIDCVVFSEVLEHLRVPPFQIIREIIRILKPDGRLIFSVPNISSASRIARLFAGLNINPMFKNTLRPDEHITDVFGHLREYTKEEAYFLLKSQGLVIEDLKIVNNKGGIIPKIISFIDKNFIKDSDIQHVNPYDDPDDENFINKKKSFDGKPVFNERSLPLYAKFIWLFLSIIPEYGDSIIVRAKKVKK